MNERSHATVQTVRSHRRLGLGRRRARLARQVMPRHLERDYAAMIMSVVRETWRTLHPLFDELPALLDQNAQERRHDATDPIRRFNRLLDTARAQIEAGLSQPRVEAVVTRFGQQIASYHQTQLDKQLRAGLGVDLFIGDKKMRTLLAGFARENVALITNIPRKMVGDLEKTVSHAFARGKSSADIAELLQDRFNIEERRAQLIARDQTLTLYGQFNESRQTELGIRQFVWRTVGDEAVRPEHAALDGETFDWDDPPENDDGEKIIPGQEINCRCWAEPVLSEIFASATEEE